MSIFKNSLDKILTNSSGKIIRNFSGGSAYFDGVNDYIGLGNPTALQITGDQTIEMWLKPANFSTRRNPYAKAYGGEGTITQEPSGILNYYYGTSGLNGGSYQGFGSIGTLALNQWNHIAIVRNLSAATRTLTWYINGTQTSTGNANYAAATAGTLEALIGQGYAGRYAGNIDEVRVWNIARSSTDIQNNMNISISPQAGLVVYYKFDIDYSDFSGNNITGIAYNGTLIDQHNNAI